MVLFVLFQIIPLFTELSTPDNDLILIYFFCILEYMRYIVIHKKQTDLRTSITYIMSGVGAIIFLLCITLIYISIFL